MKLCKACLIEKPLTEFYKLKAMADGLNAECKECVKIRVKRNRSEKADYYQEFDRKRANNPERIQARLDYKTTERGKERLNVGKMAWRSRNLEKRQAHVIVRNAVRDGRLIKPIFCDCGSDFKLHAHHADYSKPLEVTWLCVKCHTKHHVAEREQRRLQNASS